MSCSYAGVTFTWRVPDGPWEPEWEAERRISKLSPVHGTHDVTIDGGTGDERLAIVAEVTSAADADSLQGAVGTTQRELVLEGVTYPSVRLDQATGRRKLVGQSIWWLDLVLSRES